MQNPVPHWLVYALIGTPVVVGLVLYGVTQWLNRRNVAKWKKARTAQISFHRINDYRHGVNLQEAIAHAKTLGVSHIEFDVRRTSDNVLVAWHDSQLPSGRLVSEEPYETYAAEVAGMACTVEDLIKSTVGSPKLQVDLKETGYEEAVIELLLKHCRPEDFVITSLEDASIRNIKAQFPMVRCGLSLGRDVSDETVGKRITIRASELFPGRRIRTCQADFVAVNHKLARWTVLRYCHKHHLPAWVWTVDNASDMQEFLVNPVVETLITNAPDVAMAVEAKHSC